MDVIDLIETKRDGGELTPEQIASWIRSYVSEAIPDYQVSALLMAICVRGMSDAETRELTQQMLASGITLKWSTSTPRVDKHSTGGVGDKTSLIIAPILAACGLQVPMISGRGLASTGGTLDKLESIDGFNADLPTSSLPGFLDSTGCFICSASEEIAPADRKLYALRDVTGTVPSIPLITASILSKKLAEGLDCLVLDVKWGSGAFMKRLGDAQDLAKSLVSVADSMGVKTRALITDMNQPLGETAGNAIEVQESIKLLQGEGADDLRNLCLRLSGEAIQLCRPHLPLQACIEDAENALVSGSAWESFQRMIRRQGGNIDAPMEVCPPRPLLSRNAGYVTAIDTELLGRVIVRMGGGRTEVGQAIDHAVGLSQFARIGERIEEGEPLLQVHERTVDVALHDELLNSFQLSEDPTRTPELVVESIDFPG